MKEFFNSGVFEDINGGKHTVVVYGALRERKWQEAIKVQHVRVANDGSIVGKANNYDIYRPEFEPGTFKVKEFAMGYAICHEDDKFNKTVGLKIAKSRVDWSKALKTNNGKYLCADMCNAILENELNYIGTHLENYFKIEPLFEVECDDQAEPVEVVEETETAIDVDEEEVSLPDEDENPRVVAIMQNHDTIGFGALTSETNDTYCFDWIVINKNHDIHSQHISYRSPAVYNKSTIKIRKNITSLEWKQAQDLRTLYESSFLVDWF